jgi:hypothetical protein
MCLYIYIAGWTLSNLRTKHWRCMSNRRLHSINCQRFGNIYLFHLHRRVGTHSHMKMEQTERSETLASPYAGEHPKRKRTTWCVFFCGSAAERGLWPPRPRGFLITHNDAPQSAGLLLTSDQLVAEASTWQHTTHTTNVHATVGFEPTIAWASGRRPMP